MKWWPGSLILGLLVIFVIAGASSLVVDAAKVPQNLTEHSWIYSQGTIDEMRIYQTVAGFHGQKLVVGTRGTGTVSRSINAQVYGGSGDGNDSIFMNEWGVYQNRPSRYSAPITNSELKNALCAKNYEVGSVYSESYSNLVELIKDTSVSQTDNNSVYSIHSEVEGTARVGARVQKGSAAVPIYVMTGAYSGYLNMRMSLESGNASLLTLPCP
jgi:hypothetical protein